MEQTEERLANEVRKHRHLYDPSEKNYKHSEANMTSWREIGEAMDKDPGVCIKKWKAMRDKFVRLKKKMKTTSGDPKSSRSVPAYFTMMSWLHGFVKHRDPEYTFVSEVESDSGALVSSPKEENTPPMATPHEEEVLNGSATTPRQFRLLTRLQRQKSQQTSPVRPLPSPASRISSLATARRRVCSDDDDSVSTAGSPQSVPSRQPAERKRKRVSKEEDMLETIASLRREQTPSSAAMVAQLSADPHANWDEFITFAFAVADSLRKLPAERVEATKVKLFHVLGEAHAE